MIVLVLSLFSWAVVPDELWGRDTDDSLCKKSVVRFSVQQRSPDFYRPWLKSNPIEVTGTGFVIAGQRILTNAHVVNYGSQIYVQLHDSDQKLEAHVVAIAHDLDLALLRLDDASALENVPSLELSEGIPALRTEISVLGFPLGGNQMSITKGVLSRVEYSQIAYGRFAMRLQVDAAVNPGNSGGPGIADGKVIGIVFATFSGGENIGYLVHASEIGRFLRDIEDGKYDGAPRHWLYYQTVENSALRAKLQLPKNLGGVRVREVLWPLGEDSPLRRGDVITRIGPHEIDSQGKVRVEGLQLPFEYYCPVVCQDGKIPFTIWRDGKQEEVSYPAPSTTPMLLPSVSGTYPKYFILGPLAFETATLELVANLQMSPTTITGLANINSPLMGKNGLPAKSADEELVIVPNVPFTHNLMKGYNVGALQTVKSVNGVGIRNLRQLAKLFLESTDEYFEIEFNESSVPIMVFNREDFLRSTDSILEDNSIRDQYSPELADIFRKSQ